MLILVALLLVSLSVLAWAVVAARDPRAAWPFPLIAAAGFSALALLIAVLVIGLGRHYGRVTCHTFARQTGRATRFVIYNRFDTGDCLTRTRDGRWIPRDNLREFGDRP